MPAFAWMWVILYLLLRPDDGSGKSWLSFLPYSDKIAHFGVFAILSFLACYGFGLTVQGVVASWGLAFSWGGITEWLQKQLTYDRSADLLDWLADSLGGGAGIAGYWILFRLLKRP